MELMSVWLSLENYNKYMKGELVYGWNIYNKVSPINVQVPFENVNLVTDMEREGIEIDIQRRVK
jgi:hypothetical protein